MKHEDLLLIFLCRMALLWFATLLSKLEEPVLAVIVILTLSFFIFFLGFVWLGFDGDNNINADTLMNFLTNLMQGIYAQK